MEFENGRLNFSPHTFLPRTTTCSTHLSSYIPRQAARSVQARLPTQETLLKDHSQHHCQERKFLAHREPGSIWYARWWFQLQLNSCWKKSVWTADEKSFYDKFPSVRSFRGKWQVLIHPHPQPHAHVPQSYYLHLVAKIPTKTPLLLKKTLALIRFLLRLKGILQMRWKQMLFNYVQCLFKGCVP